MPQMSPLSWLLLFMIFSFTFLMFNIINYYSFLYNIKKSSKSKKKTLINWKW
uniref:ATP synthase complex subunit 8 n=1 Tax=Cucujoidea sp. 21 KM-2017 TaxID=2219358 RepID=A0A346RGE3_9CUCU|nr:ATP synthase F0 subunit 8 [Cucujoidea sp. 21 KM-2017]